MTRPLRLDFEGALWHVTARGNERKEIVRDDADRETFVRVLASVVSRYGWVLHGWVLMPNHYHLVVETPRPTLSDGMRQLGAVYSQAFNRRWERCGHLFQGRFFSLHVQRDSHLRELLRYVALNPVRAGLAKAPEGWPWGSYRATAGLERRPPWLATDWVLQQFRGQGRSEAAWVRFVAAASDYSPHAHVQNQVILGDEALVEELRERAGSAGRMGGVPASQLLLGEKELDQAASRLAAFLKPTGKGPDKRRDRALATVVLRDSCLATYAQIGAATGLAMWGARSLVGRGRQRAKESPAARRRLAELKEMVSGESRKTGKRQP